MHAGSGSARAPWRRGRGGPIDTSSRCAGECSARASSSTVCPYFREAHREFVPACWSGLNLNFGCRPKGLGFGLLRTGNGTEIPLSHIDNRRTCSQIFSLGSHPSQQALRRGLETAESRAEALRRPGGPRAGVCCDLGGEARLRLPASMLGAANGAEHVTRLSN